MSTPSDFLNYGTCSIHGLLPDPEIGRCPSCPAPERELRRGRVSDQESDKIARERANESGETLMGRRKFLGFASGAAAAGAVAVFGRHVFGRAQGVGTDRTQTLLTDTQQSAKDVLANYITLGDTISRDADFVNTGTTQFGGRVKVLDDIALEFGTDSDFAAKFVSNASGGYFLRPDGAAIISPDASDPGAAIDAAIADGYTSIRLQLGTYSFTTSSTITNSKISVRGQGPGTVLMNMGDNPIFNIDAAAGTIEGVILSEFAITSNSTSAASAIIFSGAVSPSNRYVRRCSVQNIWIAKHAKGVFFNVNAYYNDIANCDFSQNTAYDIHENNFGGNYIIRNRFYSSAVTAQVYIDSNSHQTTIIGNTFSLNAPIGIKILGLCRSTVIGSNSFSELTKNAIELVDSFGNTPTGTVINGNTFRNMPNLTDAVIRLNGGGAKTNITGNTFDGNHASLPDIKIDFAASGTSVTSNVSGDAVFIANSSSTTYRSNNTNASGELIEHVFTAPPLTFADGDTTPSVSAANFYRTSNTSPTTITTFDDGTISQEITIRVGDNNTKFAHSATIELEDKLTTRTLESGDTITFKKLTSSAWIEVSRSYKATARTRQGVTANRPSLGTQQFGLMYLDTTLKPSGGQVVVWNGAAWVILPEIQSDGGLILSSFTDVSNGTTVDSPALTLRAKYDSDPTAGLTAASRDFTAVHNITAGGASPVSQVDLSVAATLIGTLQDSPADGDVALMIRRNVGGSLSVEQISMGATDSGGAGYKLLRVPN